MSEEYITQVVMEEYEYFMKKKKKKLIFLDCDPGHDDFFASTSILVFLGLSREGFLNISSGSLHI